jgi:hypothetical protein
MPFEAKSGCVRHKRAERRDVQGVAAAIGTKNTGDGRAGERKIAQPIEHLVADALVGKTPALRVEHRVIE